MATPVSFTLYSADGLTVNAAATPTFTGGKYASRANVAQTPPTITNLGLGKYSFLPSDADETLGCVALIVTGANPAYFCGPVTTLNKPFAAVVFLDAAGALIASGTPTVPVYKNFAGTGLTAPSPVGAGTAVWSLTPSAPDLAGGGVNYLMAAPAGARAAFYDGDLIAVSGSSGSVVAPVVGNFSPALATPIQVTDALSLDVTIADGTAFANISISVLFSGLGLEEEIYDGSTFSDLYIGSSSKAAITNGFRFILNRRGGWPTNPKVKVRAVSMTGILNP